MSDPNHPAAPAARPRPGSVTIAGYLLYLVAAIQLVQLILSLSMLSTINDVYAEAFAGTYLAGSASTIGTVTLVGGGVLGLLVAIGLVVLALLNSQGKNPARIVTWVLGGLFVCCWGASLAASAAGSALTPSTSSGANVPDQAEIQQMLADRLPSWYTPVTVLLSVVSLIAVVVALILLALPPSNEFFRKPQPVWEPPVPGSAYPGYPQSGYPQSGPPPATAPQQFGPPPPTPPPATPPGSEADEQAGPPPPPSGPSTS